MWWFMRMSQEELGLSKPALQQWRTLDYKIDLSFFRIQDVFVGAQLS